MSNKTPVANDAATESGRRPEKSEPKKSLAQRFLLQVKQPKTWLVILAIFALLAPFLLYDSPKYSYVELSGSKTVLELARTGEEREKGLSGRKSLAENKGMLFIFEKPDKHCFWMKDTLINLDIIWLDANQKIVSLHENMVSGSYPTTYCPSTPASYAIELKAGVIKKAKLQAGQQLALRNITEQ